jgi:hypothetical protein
VLSCNPAMSEIKLFASGKNEPYGTDVSGGIDRKWTNKAAVSAFVLIALGSFCSPFLQTFYGSTAGIQRHRQQFNDDGKVNLCVLAKTSTKVCVRKSSGQQVVQLFSPVGEISSRSVNFPARSLCPLQSNWVITRGGLTLRERGPPV